MRYVFALWILLIPTFATAQDGLVARTIESQLSTEDRIVRVTGLSGSLSSRATVETITVADRSGVWLTITDAVLDWDRRALLNRRLSVETLSAASLTVARAPLSGDTADLPDAEASGFSIPRLPLVIQIDDVSIDQVSLGPTVLGEAAVLSVQAALLLEDGQLDATLNAERLDQTRGSAAIVLGFTPDDEVLTIDISATEPAGGIAARALSLPGLPSVALTVQGTGPLDDFAADVALATDGTDRLSGQLRLLGQDDGRRFNAFLSGDLRPLLTAQAASVLGAETVLDVRGTAQNSGTFDLDAFRLETGDLALEGQAVVPPGGWPSFLQASGRFAGPLPGSDVTVGPTAFDLSYDSATGPDWAFQAQITDFAHPQARADAIAVTGAGPIDPTGPLPFQGQITLTGQGSRIDGQGVQQAIGPSPQISTRLSVSNTGVARLTDLIATLAAGRATGALTVTPVDGQIALDADLDVSAPDLRVLAGLAGRPLAGQATASVTATASVPAGTADISLTAQTNGLSAGLGAADALISPPTTLTVRALRTVNGITLRGAEIANSQVSATASGTIGPPDGTLSLTANLRDLATLVPAVPGRVEAQATLIGLNRIDARVASATGLGGRVSGQLAAPAGLDLVVQGTAPLALAQPFLPAQAITGQVQYDLSIFGDAALSSVTGQIQTADMRIADPDLGFALDRIRATVGLSAGTAQVQATGQANPGTVTVSGPITLSAPYPTDLAIAIDGLDYRFEDFAQTTVDAQLQLSGTAARRLAVSGSIGLSDTDVQVPDASLSTAAPIPDITHVGAPTRVLRTLDRAGLMAATSENGAPVALPLDIAITARTPIFVRGRGLDAVFGGALRLGGTAANPQPVGQFTFTRGRLELLGQRLDLTEGIITLNGALVPDLRVAATTRTGDVAAQIGLEGPADDLDLVLSSIPTLPEDEILARILFGKSASNLSALQVARLVNALSGLTGETSLFSALRDGLGVDDLDLQSTEDGSAELTLGRRISEDVYSEVDVTSGGGLGLSLNLDLTDNTTLRGSVDNEGSSGIGLFWQKDY